MKILEISDRGIKLSEDGEIINQILYNEFEDIPFEVKELLSIYEELDEITLNILMELDEELIKEIKQIINDLGWKIKNSKKISKTLKFLFIGIFIIEFIIGIFLFFKIQNLENKIFNLKKENLEYKKNINILDDSIIKLDEKLVTPYFLKKSKVSNFLIFISEISKKNSVKLEKIEFLKEKIILNGYTTENKKFSNFLKGISSHLEIKNTIFDFIKKEGEIVYFLIELEIN